VPDYLDRSGEEIPVYIELVGFASAISWGAAVTSGIVEGRC
jgi:hypothetical protein